MVATRPISALPPGLALGRYAMALHVAKGDLASAATFAELTFRDSPTVKAALDYAIKGAVGPHHTEGFTGPLVPTGIAAEAITLLRSVALFDGLQGRMIRLPFVTPVARQTGTGAAGAWVAEGHPVPVVRFSSDTIALQPYTAAAISVMTDAMLNPRAGLAAQLYLRDVLVAGSAQFVDRQLLDPSVVAAAGRPASITAGAATVASTGTTAAQITADLSAMVAAITSEGRALTWILRPQTAARLALALGASVDLPRTLLGLPVAIHAHAGMQITLVDLSTIGYADDGDFDLDLARYAALQLDTTPTNAALSAGSPLDDPTPTPLTSLWQNNLAGFKTTRILSWARIADGGVVTMGVSY